MPQWPESWDGQSCLYPAIQHTTSDAERYAPQAVHFVSQTFPPDGGVKKSRAPHEVRRLLKEAALRAFSGPSLQPFRVPGPYRLELEMMTQVTAEMLCYLPGIERQGVDVHFPSPHNSITFKLRCASLLLPMLYSPTGCRALGKGLPSQHWRLKNDECTDLFPQIENDTAGQPHLAPNVRAGSARGQCVAKGQGLAKAPSNTRGLLPAQSKWSIITRNLIWVIRPRKNT